MTRTSVVVSVRFLGSLQRAAGRRETRVEVEEGATVLDLLRTFAGELGPGFADAVFRAPGEVHTHLRVFVNDEDAEVTDRIAPDGEALAWVAMLVLPIFEGGSR